MIYNPQRTMEMIESNQFTEEMRKEYLEFYYIDLYKKNKRYFLGFLKFLWDRQQEHDENARDVLNTILFCLLKNYSMYSVMRLLDMCEKLNIK